MPHSTRQPTKHSKKGEFKVNVVIYARFSSHNQTEQSIEGQLKVCYEFAKRQGYNVIGEYIDRAISGTTDNRPDFKRMIEDSKAGHFQGVLVYQLDRFARNRYDSATYKAKLKKNGVRVFSARENISDDASGVLMESVLEGMAEYFSRELSQKVTRGLKLTASKCLCTGSTPPFGYKFVNQRYEIDEETAGAVKHIYEMYASGKTIVEIVQYLNDNHYTTSRGNKFQKTSLTTILKNEKYVGLYCYSDIKIKDGVPRIISDELFSAVQDRLKANKKAPAKAKAKEDYILTTKLFCGHCKTLMTGTCGTSQNGSIYNYYMCSNARKKQCKKTNVRKQYIEDMVVNVCRSVLTDENIEKIAKELASLSKCNNNSTNMARLNKLLIENESAVNNLFKALECGQAVELITNRIQEKNKERLELENQLRAEAKTQQLLTSPQIKFFLNKLKNDGSNDLKTRKALISVFVNAIYLYNNKITIILNVGSHPTKITKELVDNIESTSKSSDFECSALPQKNERAPTGSFIFLL